MTKADIAREAARLGLDAGISHSCYDPLPDGAHCGGATPAGCATRASSNSGLDDPTRYA